MESFKEFRFETVYGLSNILTGYQYGRFHGHSFDCPVTLRSVVALVTGWVQGSTALREISNPLEDQFDHHCLNGIGSPENPVSGVSAHGFSGCLVDKRPSLYEATGRELWTRSSICWGLRGEPGAIEFGTDDPGSAS